MIKGDQFEAPVVEEWYRPGESIQAFHDSQAFYRVLIGGRGSGKTCADSIEAIRHGWHNPGARVICLRKTETSQGDTSVKTFNQTYAKMGALYAEKGKRNLFRSWRGGLQVRVPSKAAVEAWNEFISTRPSKMEIDVWLASEGERLCSYIEFKGLKDAKTSQVNLRGLECSMLILIEADQLEREDLRLARACLRWKCADGKLPDDACIIMDSNPPSPRHWIAELEKESKAGTRDGFEFWHIPTHENAHNMEPGYVDGIIAEYADQPAMLQRMVYGQYAEAFEGKPVFHSYKEGVHAFDDLPWPKGAYLGVGWDFGAHNANEFAAYFERGGFEYLWFMKEQYAEGSDTDTQCGEVKKILECDFPFHEDRSLCSGVLHFYDPAGNAKTSKGSDISIVKNNGFKDVRSNLLGTRSLQTTLAIMNRLLAGRDDQGNPLFRIDRQGCPMFHRALMGEYRYPKEHEPGYQADNASPLKGPLVNGVDHPADSARYLTINIMKLAKNIVNAHLPSEGVLARKPFSNPSKTGHTSNRPRLPGQN